MSSSLQRDRFWSHNVKKIKPKKQLNSNNRHFFFFLEIYFEIVNRKTTKKGGEKSSFQLDHKNLEYMVGVMQQDSGGHGPVMGARNTRNAERHLC